MSAAEVPTGDALWIRRYDGPSGGLNTAKAVRVSPDGSTVFVTGGSSEKASGANYDYATLAYDATTGATHGSKVFVTGDSAVSTGLDYATVAYSAG